MISGKGKAGLIDNMVELGDLVFEEAEVEQVCGFESAESMEGEVVVVGGHLPMLAELVRYFSGCFFDVGHDQVVILV